MEDRQIEALIKELTLAEKLGMIHGAGIFHTAGVPRLGIPPLRMSDGPMGVRQELTDSWEPNGGSRDYVSYLPGNSALACTWNPDQAQVMGEVLGREARGRGKDVILAPGINIIRTPLCGRNFEYMSEDPYLTAQLAVPLIKGIQSQDTAACVKHFAANNQETRRMDVDVQMDERTLREIYLPAFEAAVKEAGTKTIMGAYNRFRGQHCCHNRYLLDDVLRGEWKFDGVVISDWGGVHDTAEAATNGLDIEMGVSDCFDDYYLARPLLAKINSGEIAEALIDEKVANILRLMDRLHMLDGERKPGAYNLKSYQEQILACAEEAVVLLKNEDNCLPLKTTPKSRLAVIGENAVNLHAGGGGSAVIKALYEISPLMGLHMELGGDAEITYTPGYQSAPLRSDRQRQEMIEKAAELAAAHQEVILFCGLDHDYDTEEFDRSDMKLPYGQETLIQAVLDANPNTVIVVIAGSPVDMEAFADRAKAVVYSSYNGMEGGLALARVLLGRVNPSGRLPFTIPKRLEDCPAHKLGEYPGGDAVSYKEGVFVGYRYYTTENQSVRYCFGHGLSYTRFRYSELNLTEEAEAYCLTAVIENIGTRAGAETVQLYSKAAGKNISRPQLELKGFQKLVLEPGECRRIEFKFTKNIFSYYMEETHSFTVPEDDYEICLGASVNDIRLVQKVVLGGHHGV